MQDVAALIDPPERDPWVDLEAPRGPQRGAEDSKVLTLTITERDGWLSPAAALWVAGQCAHLGVYAPGASGDTPIKLRIQKNVDSGAVSLVPSIDAGISVRAHRGGPARRFYVARLLRPGLVRPKQVIRLRIEGGRLMLLGVKAAI
jgi:hypothetical protein